MPHQLPTSRRRKLPSPQSEPPPLDLATAHADFIASRQAQNFSPRTLEYYHGQLDPFVVWAQVTGIVTIDQVTAKTVRTYLVHLQERNLAAWTIHGAARAIRAFLRFCAAEEYIAAAPRFAMPKLPKVILPALDPAQVQRLLAACEYERDRVLILFLLDTVLRAAELVALSGSDYDDRTGEVFVRRGKGGKDRIVYVGAKTRRAVLKFWHGRKPPAAAPLWTNLTSDNRLAVSGLRQMLRRVSEQAGVEDCTPHTFRRTFALWSLRAGMNIYTLARLMGHEDITVLRQYLALAQVDLRAAHEQASPVDRLLR